AGVGGVFLDAFLHAVEPLDAADLDDGDDVVLLVLRRGVEYAGQHESRRTNTDIKFRFTRHFLASLGWLFRLDDQACPGAAARRSGSLSDAGIFELQFVQRRRVQLAQPLVESGLVEFAGQRRVGDGNGKRAGEVTDQPRILQ